MAFRFTVDLGMSVLVKLGLERQATMEPNFRRSCSKSTGFLGTWSCPRHLVSQLLDPTASRATWYCMPDSRHAWLGLLGWERDDDHTDKTNWLTYFPADKISWEGEFTRRSDL